MGLRVFGQPESFWLLLVVITINVAAVVDLLTLRIPNALSLTLGLTGLVVQCLFLGAPGLIDGIQGIAAGMVAFLPFYLVGWMGAGDVKLLMAVGACLGWRIGIESGLAALMIGIPISVAVLLMRGGFLDYLNRYGLMVRRLFSVGKFVYIPPEKGSIALVRFPFAFAIALGTMAALAKSRGWII